MSTLMVSISGIRGIIGGGLEPQVIVKYFQLTQILLVREK